MRQNAGTGDPVAIVEVHQSERVVVQNTRVGVGPTDTQLLDRNQDLVDLLVGDEVVVRIAAEIVAQRTGRNEAPESHVEVGIIVGADHDANLGPDVQRSLDDRERVLLEPVEERLFRSWHVQIHVFVPAIVVFPGQNVVSAQTQDDEVDARIALQSGDHVRDPRIIGGIDPMARLAARDCVLRPHVTRTRIRGE